MGSVGAVVEGCGDEKGVDIVGVTMTIWRYTLSMALLAQNICLHVIWLGPAGYLSKMVIVPQLGKSLGLLVVSYSSGPEVMLVPSSPGSH